jgi:hypothetical protein
MKIRVFYYIDNNIDDPSMSEKKKEILQKMNKFNEYIEYEKFDKEYKRVQAAIIYKNKKNILQKKRKVTSIFCQCCKKNIQINAYNNHLATAFHKSNQEDYNKNNIEDQKKNLYEEKNLYYVEENDEDYIEENDEYSLE